MANFYVASLNIEQNWQKVPVIVTGKTKISTSRRQVLPDIDLRQLQQVLPDIDLQQTRFGMDCYSR